MMTPPETRALLALFEQIPWTNQPDGAPGRLPITLRSSQTLAELVAAQGWDTTDPTIRWSHGTQIEAAERNPGGYWEQHWPLTRPSRHGWAQDWTLEQWATHESAQFPAGFYPISRGARHLPAEMADAIRDELRSGTIEAVRAAAQRVSAAGDRLRDAQAHRDGAIRAALAAGIGATEVAQAAGVNRSRVYQLRGQ